MSLADDLCNAAVAYTGVPYAWGSHNPKYGLDCVGLVDNAFLNAHIPMPTPVWPWTVPYLFNNWSGTKHTVSETVQERGDVLVFGQLEHVGIAVDGQNCMSALIPTARVAQTSIIGSSETPAPALRFILRWNNEIIVPPPPVVVGPTIYVVKSGDTLSAIGAKFGKSWRTIWLANLTTIPNPNMIHPGQKLVIP